MSKSFKKVATIVGIAAVGFATFGIGTLLLAGTTVASATAFAGYGLALGTIFQLGLGALAIGTSPSPSIDDTGANDRGTAFYDPDAAAAYVFGRTMLPAALVDEIRDFREPFRHSLTASRSTRGTAVLFGESGEAGK